MKGGFGCSPCCGPTCETCTRTCTEPHTGAAFETVFTNYFEGVEVGNPSDGFLTATGDNDTSDPYDGMDGSGPWMQEVGGGFNDGGSYGGTTRFPCTYRFSFWRSTRQLGINNPAPSTDLTENVIELTVSAGAVVFPDGTVITPASGTVTLTTTIPLVSGGAGAVDPRTFDGTVSFALHCQNVETTFSIQARVRWNVQKRQHTVYGIVRECYEDESPCLTFCSGNPAHDVLYLTISNVKDTSNNAFATFFEGTYTVDRAPQDCQFYFSSTPYPCHFRSYVDGIYVNPTFILFGGGDGQTCYQLYKTSHGLNLCNSGVIGTGTGTVFSVDGTSFVYGSFDWKIES